MHLPCLLTLRCLSRLRQHRTATLEPSSRRHHASLPVCALTPRLPSGRPVRMLTLLILGWLERHCHRFLPPAVQARFSKNSLPPRRATAPQIFLEERVVGLEEGRRAASPPSKSHSTPSKSQNTSHPSSPPSSSSFFPSLSFFWSPCPSSSSSFPCFPPRSCCFSSACISSCVRASCSEAPTQGPRLGERETEEEGGSSRTNVCVLRLRLKAACSAARGNEWSVRTRTAPKAPADSQPGDGLELRAQSLEAPHWTIHIAYPSDPLW
mmetsp:Transcript_6735/g.15664  ORF Transcript_6735/g.15664 Transcript_6735/m.15664 type:complete len:266 (+) Transcript_6735:109-906(+)